MATPIPENHASFTAAEVALATSGALLAGDPGARIEGVCTDSRAVRANNLFVAIRGELQDGHQFVDKAITKGASAVLVAHDVELTLPAGVARIAVDDPTIALGRLARFHRTRWEGDGSVPRAVVAITGSAGKTTTKELCAAALIAALGEDAVLATHGNLNNQVGAPMMLLALEPRHSVAVIEVGTSQRGEIAALADIVRPDVALIVHVGLAHAEGLAGAPRREGEPSWVGRVGPAEAVAREKGALVAAAREMAIACADEAWTAATLALAPPEVATFSYGRATSARYRLVESTLTSDGRSRVTIERPRDHVSDDERARISFVVPLLGDVAARNATGAVAAADAALQVLGIESIDATALDTTFARSVRAVPGRLALRRRRDDALVLDDSYNASPSAFASSISTARALADASARRLVIVAGEMRELGAFAAEAHEQVARAVVAARPALVVTCGGDAERIADAAAGAGIEVERAADSIEAAKWIEPHIGPRDLVLVKGSRGVATERVVEAILARGGEITSSVEAGRGS